jgi:hypothetical protein
VNLVADPDLLFVRGTDLHHGGAPGGRQEDREQKGDGNVERAKKAHGHLPLRGLGGTPHKSF